MDIFYEESSIVKDSAKESKKYRTLNIVANIFLVIGFLSVFIGCNFIPTKQFLWWVLLFCSWFFVAWFIFFKWKSKYNVNYDYCFVSGELRIAKVINVNKRKPVVRIQPEEILQLGDIDNDSYDILQTDPNVKTVYCTSNVEATEGKFFMYILAAIEGEKKLFILECREELLLNILKFVKRSTLERDYVPQEKKKNRV